MFAHEASRVARSHCGTPFVVSWWGMDEDVTTMLKESLYAAVGFGVLGLQQAQLRRRELQKELAKLAGEVDGKVDPVLDDLEARLPDDLRPLVESARVAAHSVLTATAGRR